MEITRREAVPLALAALSLASEARGQYISTAGPVPIRAHLGLTENPFGPSIAARRAITEAITEAPFYVHTESGLTGKIAAREGLKGENVMLSSGSLDALSLLATAIGRSGHAVAPQPTYSTHLAYAERQGVPTMWVPLGADHQIDLDAMLAEVAKPGAKLAYICNPNNPTGLLLDPGRLRAFCIAAAKTVPVLIDEAYFELAPDPMRQTMAGLVRERHDVIVVRTFSKVYGMAGLRIGYILAQPARVKQLLSLTTTSRNQLSLAAATACVGDRAYIDGAIRYLKDCRERIYRICETNRLRYIRSEGTFVYIDCGMPALEMQKRLAALGVEVRLFDGAAYANWMRVGTATPAELAIFGEMLPKALA